MDHDLIIDPPDEDEDETIEIDMDGHDLAPDLRDEDD